MPLAIEASFPLGFYQGKDKWKVQEDYPSPLRLFSALTAAAYSLERQEGLEAAGGLSSDLDTRAFGWLESNPPDAIGLPRVIRSTSSAIAYRVPGVAQKGKDKHPMPARASNRSYYSSPLTWYWISSPGLEVFSRLDAIASEVPYLGEVDSPVMLRVLSTEIPEGALRRCEASFEATSFSVASKGRGKELQEKYLQSRKPSKDSAKANEESYLPDNSTKCEAKAYYMLDDEALPDSNAPWTRGFFLEIKGNSLSADSFTSWATCLHRAIVKNLGERLPRIMARPGVSALPNGLAIQVITPHMPVRDEYQDSHDRFLVMLPADTPAGEEEDVLMALRRITRLYSKQLGSIQVSLTGELVDLRRFWSPVAQGSHRLFETSPLFISNNRPPSKKKADGSRWAIEDDARVAIGYVWRPLFNGRIKGDAGRLELSRDVRNRGINVCGGRIVPTQSVGQYVHKSNPGSVLVGEHVIVDLSVLNCEECISAIGQTRHFSGGLLVPFDVPEMTSGSALDQEGASNG